MGVFIIEYVEPAMEVVGKKRELSKKQLEALKNGREKAMESPNRGRPSKIKEITDNCQRLTPYGLRRAERILTGQEKTTPDQFVKVLKLVLEYGYGKPTQSVQIESKSKIVVVGTEFLSNLSFDGGQKGLNSSFDNEEESLETIDIT